MKLPESIDSAVSKFDELANSVSFGKSKKQSVEKSSDNSETPKQPTSKKFNKNVLWEWGAYAIRTVSVVLPTAIITTINEAWTKTSIGFSATLIIIALLIIYKEPINKFRGAAPGVLPFAIFLVLAMFFYSTAENLFIVGISGFGGSIVATPLHIKYMQTKASEKSDEVKALETIAQKLDKL